MQYNFARVASGMLINHGKRENLPVEHGYQRAERSIGLAGVGLGVLFILLIIAFLSCMKRRKTVQVRRCTIKLKMSHNYLFSFFQTVHHHGLSNTQVVFTLKAATDTTKRDFPPD